MRRSAKKRVTGFEPATFSLGSCKHRMEASQAQEFSDAPSNACTSACTSSPDSVQTDAELQHVIDALAMLAEVDRDAVVAHVRALVSMSPKRRAAILTLTDPGE